jgi:hypothetical protein
VSAARELGGEIEIERALVVRLREPMGAVRLAVQILAGPLSRGLDQLDEVTRARVKSVLQTLEQSTREVCEMLAATPVIDVRAPAANGPSPAVTPIAVSAPSPRSAPPAANAMHRAAGPRAVDIDELLRRLEIVTVTRSSLPVLLAVDAHAGLQAADAGRELLPAIVGLVERATRNSAEARPGARPWTVEVRAFIDPAEILGDEMHVVLEVRHDGTPLRREVVAWLEGSGGAPADELALVTAKTVAEAAGGRVEALCAGTKTAIRVRLPESV